MRVAFALLALAAVAYAADFATLTGAEVGAMTVNGVTGELTGAPPSTGLAVGGSSTVASGVLASATAPAADFYAWYEATCVAADAAAAKAKNLLTGYASDGAATAKYNLFLSAHALALNDKPTLCIWTGSALVHAQDATPADLLWNVVAAVAATDAVVDSVAKVGGGVDFIYGDTVTFTAAANLAAGNTLSLGATPASHAAADLKKVGGVVYVVPAAGAGTTAVSMAYLGTADVASLKAWAQTGTIQQGPGTAQVAAAAAIQYKFQTSVRTLTEVDGQTWPKMNYTQGKMVNFKVTQNNTYQGTDFWVVPQKGAGTAAACDTAVTDKKALHAVTGVTSMKWLLPNVTASEDWSVWVKAANVTGIACTAQVGWTLTIVPPPMPPPTPAPAPAPAPVAPAPAAASTTGTSSASAVRGGLLAAFACVLAGLGVSAAF